MWADEAIGIDLLPDLISRLSPPLGLRSKIITPVLLMEVIKDLKIPIRNRRVAYIDTFLAWLDIRVCMYEDIFM